MIFVTVGTNEAPFDRLVSAVERLVGDEIFVQCGSSSCRPRNATCFDFLPLETFTEYVRTASAVIMHAGAGSILVALTIGRRPIVVPRLKRFGEAVDDHQLHFARRMDQRGLVSLVERPEELSTVAFADVQLVRQLAGDSHSPLTKELRGYVTSVIRPTPRPTHSR